MKKLMYIFFNYIIPQTFFRCTLFDLINIFAPMKLKLPLKLFSFQILPTQHWGRMRKFTPILMVKVFWVRFLQTSLDFLSIEVKIYLWTKCNEKIERERKIIENFLPVAKENIDWKQKLFLQRLLQAWNHRLGKQSRGRFFRSLF